MSDTEQGGTLDASDLYDSERLAFNKVMGHLQEYIGKHREIGSFQREARERFAEIGFEVRVDIFESEHENHLPVSERTKYPEISLLRRIEPTGEFDHEKMGHEVRSNLLGAKGQDNVQKTSVGQTGWSSTSSGLVVPK